MIDGTDYFINFKTSEIIKGESHVIGHYDFIQGSKFKAVNLTLFESELTEKDKPREIFQVLKERYNSEFERVSDNISCNVIKEYYDYFKKDN